MELQWIGVAFVLGFVAKRLGQPPLVGFLIAGFALELFGLRPDASLRELADVGVLLLLFTIGLKLELRSILMPQVWGVTLIHAAATTLVLGAVALGASALGLSLFASLDLRGAAVLGFALSFSSTVFAVKVLEERDDLTTLYGRACSPPPRASKTTSRSSARPAPTRPFTSWRKRAQVWPSMPSSCSSLRTPRRARSAEWRGATRRAA